MRELILKMSMSLDGDVCGPNGEIDWIFKTQDDDAARWTLDTIWNASAHLMGSRTYFDMAAYWPTSTLPFAAPMNEIEKIVFTKRPSLKLATAATTTRALEDAKKEDIPAVAAPSERVQRSWDEPVLARGDISEEIARLKTVDGKPMVAHGGLSFAQSLVASDVVDEYRLLVHPVVLGKGGALFSSLTKPAYLELVDVTSFAGGSVAHVYRKKK